MELTALILTYKYWIIIPLTFIEGPIVAFLAGALASAGFFNPYVLFAVFFVRDVTVDIVLYFLGRYVWRAEWVKRMVARFGITDTEIHDIRPLWLKHPGKTMFFSKLSYGVAGGLIMVAGVVGMPFRLFVFWGSLIALTHYGTMLMVGYVFGGAIGVFVSDLIAYISYLILAATVIFTVYFFIRLRARKRMLEEERQMHT